MIYAVIFTSEDRKQNCLGLVNADGYVEALEILKLSIEHRDWVSITNTEYELLLQTKGRYIEKVLSEVL